MNIKELRIGNLVYYGVEGRKVVARVNCLYSETSGMIHMSTDNKPHIQDMVGGPNISPIPLTPEVLEGCGNVFYFGGDSEFTTHIKWYHIPGTSIKIHCYGPVSNVLIGEEMIPECPLHRLQNIIHALTGKELDVEGVKNLKHGT